MSRRLVDRVLLACVKFLIPFQCTLYPTSNPHVSPFQLPSNPHVSPFQPSHFPLPTHTFPPSNPLLTEECPQRSVTRDSAFFHTHISFLSAPPATSDMSGARRRGRRNRGSGRSSSGRGRGRDDPSGQSTAESTSAGVDPHVAAPTPSNRPPTIPCRPVTRSMVNITTALDGNSASQSSGVSNSTPVIGVYPTAYTKSC